MAHNIDEQLLQLDLKTEAISNIESFLSNSILGHNRPTIKTCFEGLFRTRKVTNIEESNLLETKSIWYPDWTLIPESNYVYNRCSDKGQNFFYSSNCLEATIKELNPANGDIILIGIFLSKFPETKADCQFAGIEALRNNKKYNSDFKDFKYKSVNDKKIEEVLSSKFQEIVSQDEDFKYKLSIAFSNILLKNPEIECLIYPSVASNLKFTNYGLKPSFVDEHLYCSEIFQYSVEKTKAEYILTPEKFGQINHNLAVPKNSKITWNCNNLEHKKKLKYYL